MVRLRLLAAALLAGCAHRRAGDPPPPEPPPAWATERGRREARMALARVLLDAGNPEAALQVVRQLRAAGADGPDLDVIHAEALRDVGLADDAESMLRELVRRHPRRADAWNQLGILLLDDRRVEEAVDAFRHARELDPDDAGIANNLGFALLGAGLAAEAVDVLREALRLDSTDVRTRNNLGFALVAAGREREAWRVFRAAEGEADAHYNLGLGLELRGAREAALAEYRRALEIQPAHALAAAALRRLAAEEEP